MIKHNTPHSGCSMFSIAHVGISAYTENATTRTTIVPEITVHILALVLTSSLL